MVKYTMMLITKENTARYYIRLNLVVYLKLHWINKICFNTDDFVKVLIYFDGKRITFLG